MNIFSQKLRSEFCKLCKESLQDNRTGKYSHAKIISMFGFFALTIFMWKLILIGGLSVEFFIAYSAYCTGHQTLNKWLDGKTKKETE